MDLSEFYSVIGGDMNAVLERLPGEAFAKKFVKKFPADPSYAQLNAAMLTNDPQKIFEAAHLLKGVTANLGLGSLYSSVSVLTDEVRHGTIGRASELFSKVREDYEKTIEAIDRLD